MSACGKQIIRDDPYADWEGNFLEFRLTYEGPLYSESRRASVRIKRATHKQDIRKKLHPQLRHFWELNPHISNEIIYDSQLDGKTDFIVGGRRDPVMDHTIPALSARFSRFGYKFVPLATRNLDLLCDIHILMLRINDDHGVLANSYGDIDNRFKVLFDALTLPRDASQVGDHQTPTADEDPFFCLLEDDSMVTKASVETDALFQPVSDPPNPADVRVVMTIKLWPEKITVPNFGFA